MTTMKPVRSKILCLFLTVAMCGGLTWVAQAGTVTDQFNSGVDFLANGVTNTIWDGVYLISGDVPNGVQNGGTGLNVASAANETTYPGYLTVQNVNGYWNIQADDGFYLWKVVSGDFDVQVTVVNPFENGAYHMPGLMVRAFTTNGPAWGAPFSTTSTNALENFLQITRFNEFSIGDLCRFITNNTDVNQANAGANGFGVPFNTGSTNYNTETNDNREFRITRTGDFFSFYDRTNDGDAWVLEATNNRPDLDGIPMQVGINDAEYTASQFTTFYTNFVLSGPNVGGAVTPPTDPTGLSASVTSSSEVTFNWTPGGTGSILVIRKNNPMVTADKPINGYTYNANTNYPGGDNLGGNIYVVYAGSGNSAVITGLGSVADSIYAAVYSYSGSGSSTVYGVNPAETTTTGSQPITNLTLNLFPTNVTLNGAAAVQVVVTYGDGSTTVNPAAGVTLTSANTAVATITGNNGAVTGVGLGSSQITATYGSFSATNFVNVNSPAFADGFTQNQDYVANGLIGSIWDGLFLNFGDVPNANKGNDNVAGAASRLNANLSNTNALTVEAAGSTWAVAGNDGPYLFKIVTGDFEASVHVGTSSTINNFDAGIMARLYDNSGGATQGGGGGAGGTETHINWVKVQNGTPAVRRTIDSGGTTVVNGLSATDGWLLMARVNSTNFYMFESSNPTNVGWTFVTNMVVAEAAANAPMEVGIEQEMRTASDGSGQLDTLMIDGPGITPPGTPPPPAINIAVTLNADLSMTFNWNAADASGNPIRSGLVMRPGGPVTAVPTLAQAGSIGGTGTPVSFGSGLGLGGDNRLVFATGNPAASTNVTCTVQGLTPGVVYYAAVVTFVGSGGNKSFNTVVQPNGTTNQQDGLLQGVYVLPVPSIPLGGLQVAQVYGVYGGVPVNVSAFAAVTVANTNVVQFGSGAFTGISLGNTTAQVIYGGVTNTIALAVRPAGFTDEFGANQDYLANGVTNSPWDGIYRQPIDGNEVPESFYSDLNNNGPGLGTASADANITSNNVLTIVATGDGWENDAVGGLFLFKYVPGDFQMAVHLNSFNVSAYHQPGLLARAYSMGVSGNDQGAPFVLGITTNANAVAVTNGESWVSLTRFDEFGIGTYGRLNLDSAVQQSTQPDSGDTNYWLMIVRSGNGSQFNLYKRENTSQAWQFLPLQTAYQAPEFAGVPMQVGVMSGPWWWTPGVNNTVMFEHFMLDAAAPALQASPSGGLVNLSWPAVSFGAVLQQTLSLSPANWQPVAGTLTTNAGVISISVPMTNSATFFRLSAP